MWIPDDPERFTSKFKYVEFARYIEDAFPIKDKASGEVVGWRPGVIRKVKVHNRGKEDEYKQPLLFSL